MKGFVISWFFPPINSSEGLVTFKLLKNSRLNYDVYTQNSNVSWAYGNSENLLKSKNINTIYGDSSGFDSWKKGCIDYFKENHEKYDFIMTRSMPPESHEIGLELKKLFPEIIWISSFGDPIHNSPYSIYWKKTSPYAVKGKKIENISVKFLLSPKRIIKHYLWSRNQKVEYEEEHKKKEIEESTILNSQCVIFNNEFQKKYMLKNLDEQISKKGIVLPHSFDLELYDKKTTKTKCDNTIKFVYLGHLDLIRTPLPFLNAILKLRDNYRDLYEKIKIDFYGTIDDYSKLFIFNNKLYDKILFNSNVDYLESLRIMKKSDYCLLFDGNISHIVEENIFFPGKLPDYIGSKSKIFAITMLNGASYNVLRDAKAIISSHSVDDIFLHLVQVLSKSAENKDEDNDDIKKYDAKIVAKEFDKIVKKLVFDNKGDNNEKN